MAIINDDGLLVSYECEELLNEAIADSIEFNDLEYIYAACRVQKGVKIIFDYAYDINDSEEMQYFPPLKEDEWFEKMTFTKLISYLTRLNNVMNSYYDIKELIYASGMVVEEFADYFNIPVDTVQKWFKGILTPEEYIIKLIEYKLFKENII